MFTPAWHDQLRDELNRMREGGYYKRQRLISSAQGARIEVDGRSLLNLCANNYLGLSNHPEVVAAAEEGLRQWGFGMSSVRFICGTQTQHHELEQAISRFLGTEDTILYSSCFDANGGLFETLLDADDAICSDELNHASVIDGIRLCKAQRLRYRNGDMDDLARQLESARSARHRLIVTDGVFSMDGYIANLPAICDLADKHQALVVVDDSHATGFIGPTGRGTPELFGVVDRVDLLTGTLGKALGGASGGYISGRGPLIEMLRQRSRPYLFSNSLAPPIVAATLRALQLVDDAPELRRQLAENTQYFRAAMTDRGFTIPRGDHPIVPVIFGDAQRSSRFAEALYDRGVYAIGFSYPVVPRGQARIRTQLSAVHTRADLEFAVEQFAEVQRAEG